ncbi:MAG: hypothetical protein PHW25_05315 [Zoogloea sp.]|uniref:hypothetical protein n=1 Tax=Zoogloea sp. TaxID=49181 RepID=UPI00260E26DC|nr:hypothetical protein [Zoogloea sp.]MDD3326489.1 hypothetical protein [Zoogloea sp.]
MKLNELQVDVKTLLERASEAGWRRDCLELLWNLAGAPMPANPSQWEAVPMAQVAYVSLAERLNGYARLAVVESLAGVEPLKVSGAVLLAMAREIFLPGVPEAHPAHAPTVALLMSFAGYLGGSATAEAYIAQAFHYRVRFGTTYSSLGTDPEHESLFEAMPASGLECAVALGRWGVSGHWHSFGRHLAAQGEAWQALKTLEEAVRDMELVSDDESADEEARESVYGLIDAQRDELVTAALAGFDRELAELVDTQVAIFCGDPDAAPVPDYLERLRAERAARHTPRTDAQQGPQEPVIPPAFLEAARQRRAASRRARQPDAYQGDRPADAPAPEAAPIDPEGRQSGEADPAPGPDAAI